MPSEPLWLSPEETIELNRLIVQATGEDHILLDPGRLESALDSPKNHWHYGEDDAVMLAVTLMFALVRNHPFIQGNKRTAFEASLIFLLNNGYEFHGPDAPAFAMLMIDIIEHKVSEADFHAVFVRSVRQA